MIIKKIRDVNNTQILLQQALVYYTALGVNITNLKTIFTCSIKFSKFIITLNNQINQCTNL